MSEPLLKVENVAASYGSIVALKSVSLEVYEGEIVRSSAQMAQEKRRCSAASPD